MARERFAQVSGLALRDLARTLVAILFSDEIGIVPARRTLLRQVPPRWFEDASIAADTEVRAWVEALVEMRRGEVRDGPTDLMAFVIYHSVEGLVEAAVERRPELLADPEFFEESLTLLMRYVAPETKRD
jgi:hypothetical protein